LIHLEKALVLPVYDKAPSLKIRYKFGFPEARFQKKHYVKNTLMENLIIDYQLYR